MEQRRPLALSNAANTSSGNTNQADHNQTEASWIDGLEDDTVKQGLPSADTQELPDIALEPDYDQTWTESILAPTEQASQFTASPAGKPEHVKCLLDHLEPLLEHGEARLRETVLESIKNTAQQHTTSQLQDYFVPLVLRLASGQRYTSKISACALLGVAYSRVTDQAKEALRHALRRLSDDGNPIVRSSLASKMAELAKVLEMEHVTKDVMGLLLPKLAQDHQVAVRLAAIKASCSIVSLLTQEDIAQLLVPLLQLAAKDRSWRVRHLVAGQFTQLHNSLGPHLTQHHLIPTFKSLLRDPKPEIRATASKELRDFRHIIPEEPVPIETLEIIYGQVFEHLKETGFYDKMRTDDLAAIKWSDPNFKKVIKESKRQFRKFCKKTDMSRDRGDLRAELDNYRNDALDTMLQESVHDTMEAILPQLERNFNDYVKPHLMANYHCERKVSENNMADVTIPIHLFKLGNIYEPAKGGTTPDVHLQLSPTSSVHSDDLCGFDGTIGLAEDEAKLLSRPSGSKITLAELKSVIDRYEGHHHQEIRQAPHTPQSPEITKRKSSRRISRKKKSTSRSSNESINC